MVPKSQQFQVRSPQLPQTKWCGQLYRETSDPMGASLSNPDTMHSGRRVNNYRNEVLLDLHWKMGAHRKQSRAARKVRDTLPPDCQDTLLPCPACAGLGGFVLEYRDGTHSQKTCGWCDGLGFTDRTTVKMFRRWQQILKHNQGQRGRVLSTIAVKIEK